MGKLDTLFSSKSNEWATPQDFYDVLNEEFDFTLDPCATDENHKCDNYFTQEMDGLKQDWGGNAFSAIRRMGLKLASG